MQDKRLSLSKPRISVVVPSYNQAPYLTACLRSIVEQDYPAHEIIVMDGGSTDESVAVIRRFETQLTYWQSRPDGGQPQAINAGFARATGELLTWLNSDDLLLPGALRRVVDSYRRHPDASIFYGDYTVVDERGETVEQYATPRYYHRLAWWTRPYIAQPGTVFTRSVWERAGGVDPEMHCVFDHDLWYRFMALGARFQHIGSGFVAGFRIHADSKGQSWRQRYDAEIAQMDARYSAQRGTTLQRRLARIALVGLRTISGAYFSILLFRLVRQRRLFPYVAPGALAHD